jgi:hypothetical protein
MAKQREFDDYHKYIEAVRDYWIIQANIAMAAGGRMPSAIEAGAVTPDAGAAISSAGDEPNPRSGSTVVGVQSSSAAPPKEN